MKTLDMVPVSPKITPRILNPSDAQAVSSGSVTQDSKRMYSRTLCEVCGKHDILPTSCIAHDVVPGKKDGSGVFVARRSGEPAVHVPEGFTTSVPGVYICEGQQAGKPVRIMVFRPQSEGNMGRIKCVCVLAVSGKQTPTSFSTETLL